MFLFSDIPVKWRRSSGLVTKQVMDQVFVEKSYENEMLCRTKHRLEDNIKAPNEAFFGTW